MDAGARRAGRGVRASMAPDNVRHTVEVRLFGSFRRHLRGRNALSIRADTIRDILDAIGLDRGEVGLVLVNKQPVEFIRTTNSRLGDGDLVEIYPIVTGG
jgi:molybdopterin converting factor small subunit